jgi:site-specific recombinase XerD
VNDSDIVTAFQAFLLTQKRVSHNTFSAYKKDLDQFCEFLAKEEVPLRELQSTTIKKYLATLHKKELSAQSISRKISTLKTFFHFASDRFGLTNFGSEMVFPKKDRKLPHYLTEDEVEKLLQAADSDTSLVGQRNRIMCTWIRRHFWSTAKVASNGLFLYR